ncbi:MAG: FtsX-like permease family protein [Methylobacteriaceae bacterium]|nr:FtsX-like permease family protein [Methylobacteriaceae bacterium]
MSTAIAPSASRTAVQLPLLLRLAMRDLRGGIRGFGIFIGCIFLGVWAVTTVSALSHSLSDGVAREGRTILGGDVSFARSHSALSDPERAFFTSRGSLSSVAIMRAIARHNDQSGLIDIKAVDGAYPAAGAAVLSPALPLQDALAPRDGLYGMVADEALSAKLDIKVGDRIEIGTSSFELRAFLASEPDKLSGGIGFGPRVIISQDALRASGLLQPGALVRWINRLIVTPERGRAVASDEELTRLIDEANAAFPEAGWEIRTRTNVSPQFSKNVDRLTQFLTLIGLTSLIIGGSGIANAVRGFVERKRMTIATMKALGASGSYVFAETLVEILCIACIGILAGTIAGAVMPLVVNSLFSALIPFPLTSALYPQAVASGMIYGLLATLTFTLGPLGRVHDISVSGLFRDEVEPLRSRLRWRYRLLTAAAGLALLATILATAPNLRLAIIYLGATLGSFVVLRLLAGFIVALLRRLPPPRSLTLRLALVEIRRPGTLAPSILLSLGLGLALLVTLAMIDANLRRQIKQEIPGTTPSFFFLDVRAADAAPFQDYLKAHAPEGTIGTAPLLRGRIVKVKDRKAEDVHPKENAAWVLEGDRGITFTSKVPDGSSVAKGEWWPGGYAGEPLVSLDEEIADGLGLDIGDTITVNVLGRELDARIANLRHVNWRTLGINFVLVFTPNTFAGAPYTTLVTLAFPPGDNTARENAILRATGHDYPAITSIKVKDVLDAVSNILSQLAVAIRAASSVALVAAILVLAGAIAAGRRARAYDAVILKTLGATRQRLLAAMLVEYALLGTVAAVFGLIAGAAAAYVIVTRIMAFEFAWIWAQSLAAAALALTFAVLLGLVGTWRVLGVKPAATLRSL